MPGVVIVDVHDGPIDLVLRFVRDNNGKCTILNELDDALLAKYRVYTTYDVDEIQNQYLPQVKALMVELIKKAGLITLTKRRLNNFFLGFLWKSTQKNIEYFLLNNN